MSLKYSPYVRPLRTVKSILLPNKEKGFSTRNFSYLKQVLRNKKNSILFSSYPASGWNWTADVLGYALGKHLTGEYNITYVDAQTLKKAEVKPFHLVYAADARASHQPSLKEQLPNTDIGVDYCYHTHGYWGESPLWGLDQAKTVMVVRDLPTSLFSQYSKRRSKYDSFEEFLDSENGIEKMVRFYNSWGDFVYNKSHKPVKIVTYESMREDATQVFKDLAKFCFDLDISDEIINEALDYYSFEKQKEREKIYNKDEKQHFHYKGKKSYRDEMNAETYGYIVDQIKNNIKYTFGYEY